MLLNTQSVSPNNNLHAASLYREHIEKRVYSYERTSGVLAKAFDEIQSYGVNSDLSHIIKSFSEALQVDFISTGQTIRNKVREAFEADGIQNIDLPTLSADPVAYNQSFSVYTKQLSGARLKTYFEKLISKRDEFRKKGLAIHADRLNRSMFQYNEGARTLKSGVLVSVHAYKASYSWIKGYSHDSQREFKHLFASIAYVLDAAGLEGPFEYSELEKAFDSDFSSGDKYFFGKDIECRLRKSSLQIKCSFRAIEALQVFVAEHAKQ